MELLLPVEWGILGRDVGALAVSDYESLSCQEPRESHLQRGLGTRHGSGPMGAIQSVRLLFSVEIQHSKGGSKQPMRSSDSSSTCQVPVLAIPLFVQWTAKWDGCGGWETEARRIPFLSLRLI